ncbi:hypothetical protein BJP37_19280 [Moorena bouillonii PNG]|uniref:Uncharacterized protein n=1 Tax=Moorena bouillonii PNG TaxID=568701 RepID=A0A1U7N4F8_9CYAN|nr:hypothetical protein BJP37_19280 [Moorena bouillonii PNG]
MFAVPDIRCKHSALSYQLSAISYQLSTINYQLAGALTARGQMSKTSKDFQPAVLARNLVYYLPLIS